MLKPVVTLLLFISCITFHQTVSAQSQEQTAEEYRVLGYAEQQKGNLNEALSYYTKAILMGAESPVLLNDTGVLYEEIDLYNRAKEYYIRAIELDKHYLPPYINLAYLYQRLGKKEQAAKYFKLRYELGNPDEPWAQKAKTELVKMDPRYREWAATIDAELLNRQLVTKSRAEFAERVRQGQEYYKKGETLFEEGKHDQAIKEYDMALQLSPRNPKILNARNKVLLEVAKKNVRERSEQALKMLDVGDTLSARFEIQKMLTTIPKEPILIQP